MTISEFFGGTLNIIFLLLYDLCTAQVSQMTGVSGKTASQHGVCYEAEGREQGNEVGRTMAEKNLTIQICTINTIKIISNIVSSENEPVDLLYLCVAKTCKYY